MQDISGKRIRSPPTHIDMHITHSWPHKGYPVESSPFPLLKMLVLPCGVLWYIVSSVLDLACRLWSGLVMSSHGVSWQVKRCIVLPVWSCHVPYTESALVCWPSREGFRVEIVVVENLRYCIACNIRIATFAQDPLSDCRI